VVFVPAGIGIVVGVFVFFVQVVLVLGGGAPGCFWLGVDEDFSEEYYEGVEEEY